ncbi:hypothetical protein HYT59_01145 [Candidatus Woesebacteria bacterium]|nr:hypothetical protein [Candidatus Woesebacteria bacterium]
MAKFDQEVRRAYGKNLLFLKIVRQVDKQNLIEMKKMVKKFGWPTISLVSRRTSHMAWLLVQHADSDVRFQQHCLELMKRAVKGGEVTKANIAYLTDRILVNKGTPQIYGTQFYRNRAGKLLPRPVLNVRSLDRRRKEMGLASFKDYKQKVEL